MLHPIAKKHKGHDKVVAAEALKVILEGDEAAIVAWHVEDAGWMGVSEDELRIRANLPGKPYQAILKQFISQQKVLLYDKERRRYIDPLVLRELQEAVIEALRQYHKKYPLKAGMPKEELAAQLPKRVDVKLYNYVLRQLANEEMLAQEREWVRLTTHKVDLTEKEKVIRDKIEDVYQKAALQPPFFRDVVKQLPGTDRQHADVLEWMLGQETLLKVKEDLYFHRDTIADLRSRLIEYLKEHGEINAPQFKELSQVSRKYAIPLLEYMDAQKVTIRVGDERRLRESIG